MLLPVGGSRIYSSDAMSDISSESWFLRKHEDRTVFGPVPFDRVREWARTAQVAPHDMVSDDGNIWIKAPMVPELEMDWLVQLDEELLYGPTTTESVIEFLAAGEITPDTTVINCKEGFEQKLSECDFFPGSPEESDVPSPTRGVIRANLQKRVRELEASLLERRSRLVLAEETIRRLETKVKNLEARLREVKKSSGGN